MSRILVVTLLTLNLMLIGVQVMGHSPEPIPGPPPKPAVTSTTRDESGLPRIVLVGEGGTQDHTSRAGLQCFTLGPFETESSLRHVREALDGYALEWHERRTEALTELGYWVSLPPFDSFAAAGEAMRELQRLGLEDIAVVNNEPGVYHVSLGYFLDERNARRRRDDVRLLGFEAVTRLQREAQDRWWLDYAQAPGASAVTGVLQDEQVAGLNRGIPCPAEIAGL